MLGATVFRLHGNMPQKERTRVFFAYCHADSGVLICTDVGNFAKTNVLPNAELSWNAHSGAWFVWLYANVPEEKNHPPRRHVSPTLLLSRKPRTPAHIPSPPPAARGLDFPRVDWIVQFDPPGHPADYIHRVLFPFAAHLMRFASRLAGSFPSCLKVVSNRLFSVVSLFGGH